jgi:outer membrane lipoprotein-sorting protein
MRTFFMLVALIAATVAGAAAATAPQPLSISLRDVINTVELSFSDASRYDNGQLFLVDVTADFFQRSTLAANQREMRADGQLYLRNADYRNRQPFKFRFDYYRPTTHQIISDGATLWTYLRENRQVILSEVVDFFAPAVADPARNRGFNFLQGLPRISKDFQIAFSPQGRDLDGNYILELNPRLVMETIEKLFIVVRFDSVRRYVLNGRQMIIPANLHGIDGRSKDFSSPELAFPILSTTVIDHRGNSTLMEFSNIQVNRGLDDAFFRFDIPADVQALRPPR